MTSAESYQALGELFAYPLELARVRACLNKVAAGIEENGAEKPLQPFATFLEDVNLGRLQENYVATFDFDPARAPYLGHHLFEDHEKRAAFMISVRQLFARHGFTPRGCELPDHLSVLLEFLAHLGRSAVPEVRRSVAAEQVLPGVKKLVARAEFRDSPWYSLVRAAELILEADTQEVEPC
ncbi:respiratory nitrate reductase subunit delta [Geomonas limicola]|uniref:Respiratory nitrate reductase subunit delta n=1 Tax=Geomonas limicola TaxID=2740186 RepID=A0A6V8N490_9BACT|nr:nitrate reductase molybdenum cofactor assembly chaperone [Geomonas limicola]GFO66697.1 respiratory nitrate reductase subunit delta [Geomonas limicola]